MPGFKYTKRIGHNPSSVVMRNRTHRAVKPIIFRFNLWKLYQTLIVSCTHFVIIDFKVALKSITNIFVDTFAYKLACMNLISI